MSASNIKSFEIKNIKHTDKSTDKVIFDNLSIDFPFDKLTVICSENKEIVNLLPKILTGNETIDSGSILLDGIEVSEKELKDSIYYASSLTTKFMPNITIKDVLEAANNANERNEKLSKERMNSFYENFQIKTLIEKKTDEFNENKISENKKNIILLLEAVLKCKQIIVFENFPLITSSKAIKFLKKYINKNKIVLISLVSDPTIFSNIESKKYWMDNNGSLMLDAILKSSETVEPKADEVIETKVDEVIETKPAKVVKEKNAKVVEPKADEVIEEKIDEVIETKSAKVIKTKTAKVVKEKNAKAVETKADEVIEEKIDEVIDEVIEEKIDEVIEEKIDEVIEEKIDEVIEEVIDEVIEEKIDEVIEEKIDEVIEEKIDEVIEEVIEEKIDEVIEEVIEEKIDEVIETQQTSHEVKKEVQEFQDQLEKYLENKTSKSKDNAQVKVHKTSKENIDEEPEIKASKKISKSKKDNELEDIKKDNELEDIKSDNNKNKDIKLEDIKSILEDSEEGYEDDYDSLVMSKLYDENYENTINVFYPTDVLFSEIDTNDSNSDLTNDSFNDSYSNPNANTSDDDYSNPNINNYPTPKYNPFALATTSSFGNNKYKKSRFAGSTTSSFGTSTSAFGNSSSTPDANPFGTSTSAFGNSYSTPDANPFGTSTSAFGSNSYSTPDANPFGTSTSSFGNSYSTPDANPFGTSTSSFDNGGYSTPESNPFGGTATSSFGYTPTNPFVSNEDQSNMFNSNSSSSYSAPMKKKKGFFSFFKKKKKSNLGRDYF